MQMHTRFKKKILPHIALHEATRVKRRPRVLDAADAIGPISSNFEMVFETDSAKCGG